MSQFYAYSVLSDYAEVQQLPGCKEELGMNQDLRLETVQKDSSAIGEGNSAFIRETGQLSNTF